MQRVKHTGPRITDGRGQLINPHNQRPSRYIEEEVVVRQGREPQIFPAIQDVTVIPSPLPDVNLWNGDRSRTKLIPEDLERIEIKLGL